MKYYIIAGEPSGDLHGANLMQSIRREDADASFNFWGGDKMLAIDNNLVTHIRETSIMGFSEVIKHLPQILSFFKKAKKTIKDFDPDVLILIDYPGFNLRMAKWAKQRGYKVVYYISPQVWAWKKSRISLIKNFVDRMLTILPFEQSFYADYGVEVDYVGHPLIQVIEEYKKSTNQNSKTKNTIAILPGSRKQEVEKILPIQLEALVSYRGEFDFVIAGVSGLSKSFYEEIVNNAAVEAEIRYDDAYAILSESKLALVASGTATLETALLGIPQIVCYKTSAMNYMIGKQVVDLEYISLVNLILGRSLIPELVQGELTKSKIKQEMEILLLDDSEMQSGYKELRELLLTDQPASDMAAKIILQQLNS